jgi:pyrroline-5-carboxylate reductase
VSFAVAPPAVVLVGCGNMGGALLHGWLERGIPASSITVVEPDQMRARAAKGRSVAVVADAADLKSPPPNVVVLAVKPQSVEVVAPQYARFAAVGAVVLSIAAGRTIAGLVACLSPRAAVVRAMPNTPAAVRRGVTVACANAAVDATQRAVCQDLLAAVGAVLWIDDETLMDAVTAVSGSGPAYVFLLAECLAQAGIDAGMPAEMARRLARETVVGSGELLAQSDAAPEVLRRDVTSPGGTTAAGLAVLMADGGLQDLLSRAVGAAARRSRQLAG